MRFIPLDDSSSDKAMIVAVAHIVQVERKTVTLYRYRVQQGDGTYKPWREWRRLAPDAQDFRGAYEVEERAATALTLHMVDGARHTILDERAEAVWAHLWTETKEIE